MLIIPVLRIVVLLVLLAILIDGATGWHFYNGLEVLFWDEKPDLPAGFFDLLRVVLSISLAWDAWTHTKYARLGFLGSQVWAVVLAMLLIVYQPIFPVQFGYHWWLWIDLTAFFVLVVHSWVVSEPLFKLLCRAVSRGENLLTVTPDQASNAVFLGYVSAASLFAKSTEFLPEKKKEYAAAPRQNRRPDAKPAYVPNSAAVVRPSPPLRQPSSPPSANSKHAVGEWLEENGWSQILSDAEQQEVTSFLQHHGGDPRAVVEMVLRREVGFVESTNTEPYDIPWHEPNLDVLVGRLKSGLANPNLSPDKQAAAQHGLRIAKHLILRKNVKTEDPEPIGHREVEPARARHSEQSAANTEMKIEILKAKRTQIVEALKRTTKMKRAPAGASSSRLKEGAFVPDLVGFRVEMPGGSSLVVLDEGRLEKEVLFVAAKMEPVQKVLSSYNGDDDIVQISIGQSVIIFRCGSSKLTVPIMA
mgnify:FL=1